MIWRLASRVQSVLWSSVAVLSLGGESVAFDAVDVAATQLGKPYYLSGGRADTTTFDCSSLTQYAYGGVAIELLGTSQEQAQQGEPVACASVPCDSLERGDLLFFANDPAVPVVGHVGIYEGANMMIDAVWEDKVHHDDVTDGIWKPRFLFARRVSQLPRLDTFADSWLKLGYWRFEDPPPGGTSGVVREMNGRLEFSSSALGPDGVGIVSTWQLTGDFDVQVDYRLLAWLSFPRNTNSVFLRATDLGVGPVGGVSVGRNSSRFSGEEYVFVFINNLFSVGTSDNAGAFRLKRSNSTIEAFFSSDGATWTQIGSPVGISTAPTRISLEFGSGDPDAPAGVKAAVDNFLLSAGSLQAKPVWSPPLTPIGSGPRGGGGSQSTAYDAATDTLIVFGGYDPLASPCCAEPNDVWVLKKATGSGGVPTWERLTPSAPAGLPQGRQAHSSVYDPTTSRMIVFGGGKSSAGHFSPLFNDVWVLTDANGMAGTSEWIPLSPTGGPPAPREGHVAFYNPATNEMSVFGGGDNGIMSVPNDLWVLDHANGSGTPNWTQLPLTGDVPGRIEHFAAGYDAALNRLTIVGGCCPYTNATRTLDFNGPGGSRQWTNVSPGGTPPPGGDVFNFGYDPVSHRLVVHGIAVGGGSDATWVLSDANVAGGAPTWTNTIPTGAPGSPPPGLILVGSAYNATAKKLILALNRIVGGNLVPEVWILRNADQN